MRARQRLTQGMHGGPCGIVLVCIVHPRNHDQIFCRRVDTKYGDAASIPRAAARGSSPRGTSLIDISQLWHRHFPVVRLSSNPVRAPATPLPCGVGSRFDSVGGTGCSTRRYPMDGVVSAHAGSTKAVLIKTPKTRKFNLLPPISPTILCPAN